MSISTVLSILLLTGGLILIRAFAKRAGLERKSVMGRFKRRHRGEPEVDTQEVTDMSAEIARMEERIRTLEKILDAEDPKWRTRL